MKTTINEFLKVLSSYDIKTFLQDDQLKINLPENLADSPKIGDLIIQLKDRKLEVIDFLNIENSKNANRIVKAKQSSKRPLSFGQQRLWFLDRLENNDTSYNLSSAMLIEGPLNRNAIEQAVQLLSNRQEILRSYYPSAEEMKLLPKDTIKVNYLDLSHQTLAFSNKTTQALALSEFLTPFKLSTGPNIRFHLIKKQLNQHVLIITMHHILTDGWSTGLMVSELSAIYNQCVSDTNQQLPPLAFQYSDFSSWQNETYENVFFKNDLNWWQQALKGAPLRLELPTDLPRPPVQTYHGGVETIIIPREIVNQLKKICQREKVTLYMLTIALFGILLARYTGQKDLLLGSPFSGRNHQSLENLIGYFTNTLPIRLKIEKKSTLAEYLKTVRNFCLGAFEHQTLPFEKLVEAINPKRDLSYNPVMQVIFGFQNSPNHQAHPTLDLHNLTVSSIDLERQTVSADLEVHLWEYDGLIECQFVYNKDLYHRATIKRLCHHYRRLMNNAESHSHLPALTIPMLSKYELDQMERVNQHNQIKLEEQAERICSQSTGSNIVTQFEQMVKKYPENIAVVFADQQLTYEQLNQRANSLAIEITKRTINDRLPIAVFIDKSIEMIVSLIAIIKSGAAYIPIDVSTPVERIQSMLADTNTSIIISDSTQEFILKQLCLPKGCQTILIDTPLTDTILTDTILTDTQLPDTFSLSPANNLIHHQNIEIEAQDLAYIIFTSGSSGKPKGVPVSHRSVLNMLDGLQPIIQFGCNDTWTLFHSYSFDYSIWEIWGCLLFGGRLVIVPETARQDPAQLYELLESQSVSILNLTPSNMKRLLPYVNIKNKFPGSLSKICCGAEAFPTELVGPLLKYDISVWNFYGPTEATVWSSVYQIAAGDESLPSIPIGNALNNYRLQILDRDEQPVPIGVTGEIYISGIGISRGYINRAELNQKHFILLDGLPTYRTGDLARYSPTGDIEFVGRNDFQVKMRGFRIELVEIESTLKRHPAIEQAVVTKFDDPTSEYLVAYIVFIQDEDISSSEIRAYLSLYLPEYMIPSEMIVLPQLPLSSNGKIDRKNLPTLTARRSTATQYVAPSTPLEKDITNIWKDILHLDSVGINDNFFDLGGHSLRLTQVIERLTLIGQVTELISLFKYPTPSQLAGFLEHKFDPQTQEVDFKNKINARVLQQKTRKRRNQSKATFERFRQ